MPVRKVRPSSFALSLRAGARDSYLNHRFPLKAARHHTGRNSPLSLLGGSKECQSAGQALSLSSQVLEREFETIDYLCLNVVRDRTTSHST
jgi:hypothetical protein